MLSGRGYTAAMHFLRRVVRYAFLAVVALVLIFEEWGWEPLANLVARLAKLPFFAWLERKIESLPPWAAVALFFLPALALLPIKLLAIFLISRGYTFMGLVVLLSAKIAGTAVIARLFTLTQPALMRLAWFARWYPRWKRWKDDLLAMVKATPLWQSGTRLKLRAQAAWRDFAKGFSGE